MNFKYLHLVIIAHLLSERRSIVVQPDVFDIDAEFSRIIDKFPSNPDEPYKSIIMDLFELNGLINGMSKVLRSTLKNTEDELDRLRKIEIAYNRIRPGFKIRDSIEDIERKQFPSWLKSASIHRYFKWMIALVIVQTPFFAELRQQLTAKNISNRRFSTVMCELYNTVSDLFAHSIPLGKPTCDEFQTFCYRFLRKTAETKLACETLAKPVPLESGEADPDRQSNITLKYLPKFNVIIKEISFDAYSLYGEFDELKKKIEGIPKFSTYKCTIKHATILKDDENKNTQNERSTRLHNPCFYFRVDANLDLWAKEDNVRRENFKNYEALKQLVRKTIEAEYNLNNERSDLIIIADDDYWPSKHSTYY